VAAWEVHEVTQLTGSVSSYSDDNHDRYLFAAAELYHRYGAKRQRKGMFLGSVDLLFPRRTVEDRAVPVNYTAVSNTTIETYYY
jgi:hypothetical protein